MGKTCCGPDEAGASNNDLTWRRILWIALGLNAIMFGVEIVACLLYTSPSPRDRQKSRMPSSA